MDPNIEFSLPQPKKLFTVQTKSQIKAMYRKRQQDQQNQELNKKEIELQENKKLVQVKEEELKLSDSKKQKLDIQLQSPEGKKAKLQDERKKTQSPAKMGTIITPKPKIIQSPHQKLRRQKYDWLNIIRNRIYTPFRPYNPSKLPKGQRVEIQYDDGKFLNPKEAFEIFKNYDDYGLADLVIAFPNPDFQDTPLKEGVTFDQAAEIFLKYLAVINDDTYNQKQFRIQRDMFLTAFLMLDDYKNAQQKQQELDDIKLKQKLEEDRALLVEAGGGLDLPLKKDLATINAGKEATPKGNEGNQLISPKDQKEINVRGEEKEKNKEINIGELDAMEKIVQDQEVELQEVWIDGIKQIITEIKQFEKDKDEDPLQPQNIQLNLLQGQADELQQIEYEQYKPLLRMRFDDRKMFKGIKKAYSHGEYLSKLIYQEGKPAEDGQPALEEDSDWVCSDGVPRDFLTLIRFTIIAQLTQRLKMHCRQFLSLDSKLIFLVVKAHDSILKFEAEIKKMNKQIEIGYVDLLSLEPCDSVYRPLRLKSEIRAVVNEIKKTGIQLEQQQKPVVEGEEKPKYKRVESRALEIARDAMSLQTENELFLKIGEKQIQVDQIMDRITYNLNIDTSNEKVTIIQDDEDMGRQTWEAYLIYLQYIIDFQKRVQLLIKMTNAQKEKNIQDMIKQGKLKRSTQDNPSPDHEALKKEPTIVDCNLGFIYQLIFRKSVGDSNEFYKSARGLMASDHTLRTLWDRLNIPCLSPYTDYVTTDDPQFNSIWRQYQINEKNYRSDFINMERIKLTASIIGKMVDLDRLANQKYIDGYFALHDQYQLQGVSKAPLFNELRDTGLLVESQFSPSFNQLKALFLSMQDEAQPTDFDSECLLDEASFNCCYPWYIPVDSLRDYFGEQIALYFQFLSYYTKQLSYMGLLGLIVQILQDSLNKDGFGVVTIIYSIIIVIWQTWFLEGWQREESFFSFRFGQTEFEDQETERPAFEGTYIRSIVTDELNEEYYPESRRKLKIFLAYFIALVIIIIVVLIVLFLFVLKSFMRQYDILVGTPILNSDTIPSYLNTFQIMFFNYLYQFLNDKMTNYENHKVKTTYENSLISKVFLFSWVNTFISCFIIAYMEPYFSNLDLCQYSQGEPSNCFIMLRQQITTIFVINFIQNIPEMIMPLIKAHMKQQNQKVDDQPVKHVFNAIDKFIEEQYDLEPYMTNAEVDGTAADYMEMIIQFSFLILFGVSFPVVFLLAFINNIAEIHVDQTQLFRFSRRPIPAGASNIGTFFNIMDIVSFISMFTNAGLIAFTSDSINKSQIQAFSIFLVVFLILKYILRYAIPDEPEIVCLLRERHSTQVNRLIMGFSHSRAQMYKTAPFIPNIQKVQYDKDFKQQNQENLLSGPYLKDDLLKEIQKDKKDKI